MTPAEVKSERDVWRLERSVWDGAGWWMLVNHDGSVSIHQQRNGEATMAAVKVPRRQFAAMVEWYLRDQHAPGTATKGR